MAAISISRSLRVLAHLLGYPTPALRQHLPELRRALIDEAAVRGRRLDELTAFVDALDRLPALDAEAAYVELFDRGRATSLHLFEHVHGDSRDRGPAMIDLAKTYEQRGMYLASGEMPDYLPTVLEFASTQSTEVAREFLAEMTHILQAIFSALAKRQSAYASVLGALIELSGGRAERVDVAADPALDETWEEPLAFGGCSSSGQSRPGAPQPVQLVRNYHQSSTRSSGASA